MRREEVGLLESIESRRNWHVIGFFVLVWVLFFSGLVLFHPVFREWFEPGVPSEKACAGAFIEAAAEEYYLKTGVATAVLDRLPELSLIYSQTKTCLPNIPGNPNEWAFMVKNGGVTLFGSNVDGRVGYTFTFVRVQPGSPAEKKLPSCLMDLSQYYLASLKGKIPKVKFIPVQMGELNMGPIAGVGQQPVILRNLYWHAKDDPNFGVLDNWLGSLHPGIPIKLSTPEFTARARSILGKQYYRRVYLLWSLAGLLCPLLVITFVLSVRRNYRKFRMLGMKEFADELAKRFGLKYKPIGFIKFWLTFRLAEKYRQLIRDMVKTRNRLVEEESFQKAIEEVDRQLSEIVLLNGLSDELGAKANLAILDESDLFKKRMIVSELRLRQKERKRLASISVVRSVKNGKNSRELSLEGLNGKQFERCAEFLALLEGLEKPFAEEVVKLFSDANNFIDLGNFIQAGSLLTKAYITQKMFQDKLDQRRLEAQNNLTSGVIDVTGLFRRMLPDEELSRCAKGADPVMVRSIIRVLMTNSGQAGKRFWANLKFVTDIRKSAVRLWEAEDRQHKNPTEVFKEALGVLEDLGVIQEEAHSSSKGGESRYHLNAKKSEAVPPGDILVGKLHEINSSLRVGI